MKNVSCPIIENAKKTVASKVHRIDTTLKINMHTLKRTEENLPAAVICLLTNTFVDAFPVTPIWTI